ncbi:dihydrofolate reductase family protein [Streptomyces agglomeratus]|uniref:dihydrofolate reductase family protein n=1 Tax=Streptomyces agglomeratus TaxID=285458 RepID=UPI00099FBCD2|nr:dihydrofolate reductase family protein [Streptomyces agglomeratus]
MAEDSTARPVAGTQPGSLEPLELLYEEAGQPSFGLPATLATAYGGDLGFTTPCVYANFVASLDGVVALGPEYPSSGSAISGREPADRFVMGLLRACADAVLIGAGTLRATPRHLWTPDHVCPQAAPDFRELRRSLKRATPRNWLWSQRAAMCPPSTQPCSRARSWPPPRTAPADSRAACRQPARYSPRSRTRLRMADVLAALHTHGHTAVLTEGGPRLIGHLLGEGLLDELFLTTSPVLAGRAGTPRPGVISGLELLPNQPAWTDLISARRRDSYLFLRYRLRTPSGGPALAH